MTACILAAMVAGQAGCGQPPHRSGYLYVPPPAHAWLRVYPPFLQPGGPLIAQAKSPVYETLCVVDLGPDGLEHLRACADGTTLLRTWAPTAPGRHRIRLESAHATLEQMVCVLGSDDIEACD